MLPGELVDTQMLKARLLWGRSALEWGRSEGKSTDSGIRLTGAGSTHLAMKSREYLDFPKYFAQEPLRCAASTWDRL